MGHGGAEDAQGLAYFAFHRDLGGVGGRGAACVHAVLARPAFLGGAAPRAGDPRRLDGGKSRTLRGRFHVKLA